MINSEQIRFDQKGQVEAEEASEPSVRSYMPRRESFGWECYLESDSHV